MFHFFHVSSFSVVSPYDGCIKQAVGMHSTPYIFSFTFHYVTPIQVIQLRFHALYTHAVYTVFTTKQLSCGL